MSAIMLDVAGLSLDAEDKNLLDHPSVGGVILFSRNYHDPEQLQHLCASIRQAARQPVVIAIDHEGGRVQRCREQFSAIPAMADFARYAQNDQQASTWAEEMGWLMAAEVIANGMDFSFAPVLDVNGISSVIGDRAFSSEPAVIEHLAAAFIQGMHSAGMAATGKHFPGHGSVHADSHFEIPVDERSLDTIDALDLLPFKALASSLQGMMPAHVIYPQVCPHPAGFSRHWIETVLRQQLGFEGVIFSDDLAMHGATVVGDMITRAEMALDAGCDMVLVCNDRAGAVEVIDKVKIGPPQRDYLSMMRAQPKHRLDWQARTQDSRWAKAQQTIAQIRTLAGR